MTAAEFGSATEARFLWEALRRGLQVSKPVDSVPSYDMVVDNGERMFKVQVNGISAVRPIVPGKKLHYHVTIWKKCTRVAPGFDVCAVYLGEEDRWVLLDQSVAVLRTVAIRQGGRHDRGGWEIFRRQATEDRGQKSGDKLAGRGGRGGMGRRGTGAGGDLRFQISEPEARASSRPAGRRAGAREGKAPPDRRSPRRTPGGGL